jgi:hypothetical protein
VIGGAVVVIGGFLEAVNKMPYWYTPSQRRQAFRMSYVYAALGVLLVGAGVVLDIVLS